MENIPTRNVMKEDFGWEVPVESVPLPSSGILYSDNSALKNKETVQIKAMTALEEDILASQAYIKDGTVIDKLIQSCLINKSINASDLVLGDRNSLMVAIRVTGYGGDYNITSKCNDCGHKNNVIVDLTDLPLKRIKIPPVREGLNLFEFKLPVTKKLVHFKFLDGHAEKESEAINKKYKELGIHKQDDVTSYLERVIVSIDGIEDKNKITHFVKNMPALDSRKLRQHIKSNEPGIDMKWDFKCEKCSNDNKIALPITPEFFWPTT